MEPKKIHPLDLAEIIDAARLADVIVVRNEPYNPDSAVFIVKGERYIQDINAPRLLSRYA